MHESWVGERLALELACQALSHLAQHSDLPEPVRTRCAACVLDLMAVGRDLARLAADEATPAKAP